MKTENRVKIKTFLSEPAMIMAMWLYSNKREVNRKKLRVFLSKGYLKHYTDIDSDRVFKELNEVLNFNSDYVFDSSKGTRGIPYTPTVTLGYIPKFAQFCRNFRNYVKLYEQNELVGREVKDFNVQDEIIRRILSNRKAGNKNKYISLNLQEVEKTNRHYKVAILEYLQFQFMKNELKFDKIDFLEDEQFVKKSEDITVNFYSYTEATQEEIIKQKLALQANNNFDLRSIYLFKDIDGTTVDIVYKGISLNKNKTDFCFTDWQATVLGKFAVNRKLPYEELIKSKTPSSKGPASTLASIVNKKFNILLTNLKIPNNNLIVGNKELGNEVNIYELSSDFEIIIKQI